MSDGEQKIKAQKILVMEREAMCFIECLWRQDFKRAKLLHADLGQELAEVDADPGHGLFPSQ